MVWLASQTSQAIYQQQLMMAQQAQAAEQMSEQMGTQPMMGQMGALEAARRGQGGVYGEQMAGRMWNTGRTAVGMAGLGIGVAGAMTGNSVLSMMDPFSVIWTAAKAGHAWGGALGGIGAGAIAALPFYMASQAADVYGGAFKQGMTNRTAMNSVIRNNFNFQGGQGALGRGFSTNQMGQIAAAVNQETKGLHSATQGELQQVIGQGADMGMFNATRDVESFTRQFRTMIDSLRKIQKELGGTLTEALAFTRGAQQVGIYTQSGRTQFMQEMRDTMSSTGMGQDQLMGLAAAGSMLSRATGGVGRQGALGALKTARSVGSALSLGALTSEQLSDATGGLQGAEAVQATSMRLLSIQERLSHTARGRYHLFALANKNGTGLDQEMVERYRQGDMSVGEIMRTANANVKRMGGRARAMNQEGRLRGAALEEGGLAMQLQDIRADIGERAFDRGDDYAQLVMQRRHGFTKEEAGMVTQLMRNQGEIATNENLQATLAKEQVDKQRTAQMRGLDAFMHAFEHGLQEGTGVAAAERAGARFLTRVGSMAEKAMNDFLGIQASAISPQHQLALARVSMGMGTSTDRQVFRDYATMSVQRGEGLAQSFDPYAKTLATRTLEGIEEHTPLHFHKQQSTAEYLGSRGIDVKNMSMVQIQEEMMRARMAESGAVVGDRDNKDLERLASVNQDWLKSQLGLARLGGGEDRTRNLQTAFRGTSFNALQSYAQQQGWQIGAVSADDVAAGVEHYSDTEGWIDHVYNRAAKGKRDGFLPFGYSSRKLWGDTFQDHTALGSITGYQGMVFGGVAGAYEATRDAIYTPKQKAIDYLAAGGHVGEIGQRLGRGLTEMGRYGLKPSAGIMRGLEEEARKGGTNLTAALRVANATESNENTKLGWGASIFDGRNKVDPEIMEGVVMSDDFQRALRALDTGASKDQKDKVVSALQDKALKMKGKEGEAAQVVVENIKQSLTANNYKLNKELRALTQNDEALAEMREKWGKSSAMFSIAAQQVGKDSPFAKRLQEIGGGYGSLALGKAGADAVEGGIDKLMLDIAHATPGSAELSDLNSALLKMEDGRGKNIMALGRMIRGKATEMSGEGRRGTAGAADAIFADLTGGTLSGMTFEYTQGEGKDKKTRTLDARDQASTLYRSFVQGGEQAEQFALQLSDQLKAGGMENAEQYVQDMRTKLFKNGMSREESEEFVMQMMKDPSVQEARRKQSEAAQAMDDPLGAQRNVLLDKILTSINQGNSNYAKKNGLPVAEGKT